MNYIGSKNRLSGFIDKVVMSIVGEDLTDKIFCDIFAGTGCVGKNFKPKVKNVISNDLEYYSYVLNKNYIENVEDIKNLQDYISELNMLPSVQGFIFDNYCSGGKTDRMYFTDTNAGRIDSVRQQIGRWRQNGEINDGVYYFLLSSLLESADKVANTASVYGAYLKKIKKSAQKEMIVTPAIYTKGNIGNKVYNRNSNDLIKEISGDILYLDPPYNARQYGSNYHLLNTIALYDEFTPKGKTGLRPYNKSLYCSKTSVATAFGDLIRNSKFKYIFLSYNNEGLLSSSDIKGIMSKHGEYDLFSTEYQRFRADKEHKRNHKSNKTNEYIHVLIKE